MKKRVKELAIKKVRVNSSGCLNRCKLGPIVVSYPEGSWYKISSKEDVDLFIEELLIKRRTFKKNLNSSKIHKLGWKPKVKLINGLEKVIRSRTV